MELFVIFEINKYCVDLNCLDAAFAVYGVPATFSYVFKNLVRTAKPLPIYTNNTYIYLSSYANTIILFRFFAGSFVLEFISVKCIFLYSQEMSHCL